MSLSEGLFQDPNRLLVDVNTWQWRRVKQGADRQSTMPAEAIRLLEVLGMLAWRGHQEGGKPFECRACVDFIRRLAGIGSEATTSKLLRSLQYCGFMTATLGARGGNGHRAPSTFKLSFSQGEWVNGIEHFFDRSKFSPDQQEALLQNKIGRSDMVPKTKSKKQVISTTSVDNRPTQHSEPTRSGYESEEGNPHVVATYGPTRSGYASGGGVRHVVATSSHILTTKPYTEEKYTQNKTVLSSQKSYLDHPCPRPFPVSARAREIAMNKGLDLPTELYKFLRKTPASKGWRKAFESWLNKDDGRNKDLELNIDFDRAEFERVFLPAKKIVTGDPDW